MSSKNPQPHPFLKWAGGKSRVVPQLLELFPKEKFNSYYEPFLGGGAVYFAISPKEGRLNDKNKTLIATYKAVRDNPTKLINELMCIQDEYLNLPDIEKKKEYYLGRRQEFNSILKNSPKRAALFIFLNKTGFNGMYRENRTGGYNIPFGKQARPLICDKENIQRVSKDLQRIDLTSTSYKDALDGAGPGDFVYLDPPYYPLSKTSSFTEYQAGGFSTQDQIELRDVFRELDRRGCLVMMSNSACKEIKELYSEFHIFTIKVGRAINAKGGDRGKIDEYVVTNYLPKESANHRKNLFPKLEGV